MRRGKRNGLFRRQAEEEEEEEQDEDELMLETVDGAERQVARTLTSALSSSKRSGALAEDDEDDDVSDLPESEEDDDEYGVDEENLEKMKQGPADENTLRILIATDNHLGFMESDEQRGLDSFRTLEEIFEIGAKHHVDMAIFGGDLFHVNRPSRTAMSRALRIFRKYCLGQNPVRVQMVSDGKSNFPESLGRKANYEDEHLSVQLPVFIIHGNHDDPSRDGAECLSAINLLQDAGLVNYFGKLDDLNNPVVNPVLLAKGTAKLALYGMGWVRDERLSRLFSKNKVEFLKLGDRDDKNGKEWTKIFVVHQNRQDKGRGVKNCLVESSIPRFMDMVIFGHEHECRIEPEQSCEGSFQMVQPGSSIATSLIMGETVRKHVGILEIRAKKRFALTKHPLRTVRPFVMNDIVLAQEPGLNKDAPDDAKKLEATKERLIIRVEELIAQAEKEFEEIRGGSKSSDQESVLPIVRLRVEYTGFAPVNMARFGALFLKRVANPEDLLHFYRKSTRTITKRAKKVGPNGETLDGDDDDAGYDDLYNASEHMGEGPSEESPAEQIAKIVNDNLSKRKDILEFLNEQDISNALESYVSKQESNAFGQVCKERLEDAHKLLKRVVGERNEREFDQVLESLRSKKSKEGDVGVLRGNQFQPEDDDGVNDEGNEISANIKGDPSSASVPSTQPSKRKPAYSSTRRTSGEEDMQSETQTRTAPRHNFRSSRGKVAKSYADLKFENDISDDEDFQAKDMSDNNDIFDDDDEEEEGLRWKMKSRKRKRSNAKSKPPVASRESSQQQRKIHVQNPTRAKTRKENKSVGNVATVVLEDEDGVVGSSEEDVNRKYMKKKGATPLQMFTEKRRKRLKHGSKLDLVSSTDRVDLSKI